MAVKKNFRNKAYGLSNPLQSLAPQLIISQRAPTFEDFAELGTEWVDQSTDTFYVLTSITGGSANWAAQSSTGSGTFTDVSITGTSGTVLEVASGGATNLGGALDVDGERDGLSLGLWLSLVEGLCEAETLGLSDGEGLALSEVDGD